MYAWPARGAQVLAYVNRVRDVSVNLDNSKFTMEDVEANIVRCPDPEAAEAMIKGAAPGQRVAQCVSGEAEGRIDPDGVFLTLIPQNLACPLEAPTHFICMLVLLGYATLFVSQTLKHDSCGKPAIPPFHLSSMGRGS